MELNCPPYVNRNDLTALGAKPFYGGFVRSLWLSTWVISSTFFRRLRVSIFFLVRHTPGISTLLVVIASKFAERMFNWNLFLRLDSMTQIVICASITWSARSSVYYVIACTHSGSFSYDLIMLVQPCLLREAWTLQSIPEELYKMRQAYVKIMLMCILS